MKYLNFVWLSLVTAFGWFCSEVKQGRFQVTNMTCEYLSYPLGIVGKHLLFGWQFRTQEEAYHETTYELESGKYEFTMPWQTLYEDIIRMNPFQLESQDD